MRPAISRNALVVRTILASVLCVAMEFIGKYTVYPTTYLSFGPFDTQQLIICTILDVILVATVIMAGRWAGMIAGAVSAVGIVLIGIGLAPIHPLLSIAIIIGYVAFPLVFSFLFDFSVKRHAAWLRFAGAAIAAVVKCLLLWGGVSLLLMLLPSYSAEDYTHLMQMFSWQQAVTGALGGVFGVMVSPTFLRTLGEYYERYDK